MRYQTDTIEIDTRQGAIEDWRDYIAHLPRNVSPYRHFINFLIATVMCLTDVRGERKESLLEYLIEKISS